jgi:hypothetical protein
MDNTSKIKTDRPSENSELIGLRVAVETLSTQVKMALGEQKRTNERVDMLINTLFGNCKENTKGFEGRLDNNDRKIAWVYGFCAVNGLAIFGVVIAINKLFNG